MVDRLIARDRSQEVAQPPPNPIELYLGSSRVPFRHLAGLPHCVGYPEKPPRLSREPNRHLREHLDGR